MNSTDIDTLAALGEGITLGRMADKHEQLPDGWMTAIAGRL